MRAMLRDLTLRLRAVVAPRRVERELDEELAFHVERETQKHVASGLDVTEARRRALARFGSVALAAEACRDERGTGFIDTSVRDVTDALRACRRAPLSALTIVFTIALGLGLVTAVFTFFDAYFLRVDAVQDPHELFTIKRTFGPGRSGGVWVPFTRPEYDTLRTSTEVLTDAAGMITAGTTRIDGLLMRGTLVTGNFFEVLGVSAALGGTLMAADDEGRGRRVLVLSHRGWNRLLAADPSAVGRTVHVNGSPYQIAGVMPEDFRGLQTKAPDYWAPFALAGDLPTSRTRDEPIVDVVVGRLKAGVSPQAATTALTTWASQADLRTMPALEAHQQPRFITLEPSGGTLQATALIAGIFTAVFFTFGLVLLIGCANVANLLLARGVERQREIGVRMALGASRGRIVRQLLTESLLLAVAAAACGFAVSRLALTGALAVVQAGAPGGTLEWLLSDLPAADWRVVLFLAAGAIIATASFGLLPALQGTRFAQALRTLRGEVAGDAGPNRARHVLIAAQVGASALLLICAAVFLRGAGAAAAIDFGVRTSDTLVVPITNEDVHPLLLEEVKAHPLVANAAASTPRFGEQSPITMVEALADDGAGPGARTAGSYQLVSRTYFDVLGIRVAQGRTFTPSENTAAAGVVVLSDWLARRLFPDETAVGRAVRFGIEEAPTGEDSTGSGPSGRTYTVVGVVHDPHWRLGPYMRSFAGVYVPMRPESPATELAVQVRGDPERARLALLDRLVRIDPSLGDIVTLRTMFGTQEHLLRTGFRLTVVLGALALVLTVSGLFGVLSYLVAQRTNEIGVRLALGATTRNVTRLVLSQSLRAVAIGLIAGATLAGGLAKGLMAMPAALGIAEIVQVYDPIAYAAGLLVILAACALAASLPALRAARIDPATTLKQE